MRPARVTTAMLVVCALAACGADATVEPADRPLLATTAIWADITSAVACGEPVDAVIPTGADAHTYEPSLRDRERLETAAVVVANGAGLEGQLVDLLADVGDSTNLVEVATHVDLLQPTGDHDDDDHDDEHDDDHDDEERAEGGDHTADEHRHGEGDPHYWLDPTRVAGAVDVIASAVIAAGRDAATVDACAIAYRDELLALDAEIAAIVADVTERELVTNHDSLAYFADRYGFEVAGTVVPATSSLAETDPATLAALSDRIGELGVRTIFTESAESSVDADALAERLGIAVVELDIGSIGDPPLEPTYIAMLRATAAAIVEALSP